MKQLNNFDIAIIGAGPAGTSAAINVADTSLKIAVVDTHQFPREKICGDGLSGSVIETLRKFPGDIAKEFMLLEPKLRSTGVRFVAPSMEHIDIPLSSDEAEIVINKGFVCKRADFDYFLFKQLEKYPNIDVIQNFKVDDIIREENGFLVKQEENEIKAKMIIGADGINSIVSKLLTNNKLNRKHISSSVMAYFSNVNGFHIYNYIELHFHKDILPGYFWIFPMKDNKANVGIGSLSSVISSRKINLKQMFSEIIETHPNISQRFKYAERVSEIRSGNIPLGSKDRHISGERFILCGDAAGLGDPFTSEGISYAMKSGYMAAEQIKKCFQKNDFSPGYMKGYDNEIRKSFGKEFRINYRIQKLSKFPWLINLVVRKVNKNPELKDLFIKMFNNMDIRSVLTKPSFYLRLFFK